VNEDLTRQPDAETWIPSRGVRIVVGLLSGVGATGITVGLGLIGTFLHVDQYRPPLDLSGPILLAPLVIVPGYAGAVLRGRAAVAAITAGAIASPIGANFAVEGSCLTSAYLRIGLAGFAMFALIFTGLAALAGARIGGSQRFERNRMRGVAVLVVVGVIGVVAWIAAVTIQRGCT
jgi:hypothetical protein